jgi:hypothetical protein
MAWRMATILSVQCSYFYEENNDVAALLLLYFNLDDSGRKRIMEQIASIQK